jgi:hypothetical protein
MAFPKVGEEQHEAKSLARYIAFPRSIHSSIYSRIYPRTVQEIQHIGKVGGGQKQPGSRDSKKKNYNLGV